MTATPGKDLPPLREIAATINPAGTLRVWGLAPNPTAEHHLAIDDAYNELVNLLARLACGPPPGYVLAAVRTPEGPWHIAVGPDARTIPWDAADFTLELPELTEDDVQGPADDSADVAPPTMPESLDELLPLLLASDDLLRAAAHAELATWGDDPTPVADAALDAALLDSLAGSQVGWVRTGVAANPGTESATLARLAEDDDPVVRQAVAARFDLDPEVSEILASDAEPVVRAELGRNPAAAFLSQPTRAAVAVADPEDVPSTGDDAAGDLARGDQNIRVASPVPSSRSSRAWRIGAATVTVLLTGAAVYALVSHGRDDPGTTTSVAATALWNGMNLPVGPDGPEDPTGPVADGFARTETGAALAAAHLSVRIDPYAGPASFVPTITEQTLGGDSSVLLDATQDRYDTAAARTEVADGDPIPTTTGQITGWRSEGWSPDAPTTVHLLVSIPDGSLVDYAIDVVWVDGDYALIDPTRADQFETTPEPDPSTYRSF